jgi:hypothetical protein
LKGIGLTGSIDVELKQISPAGFFPDDLLQECKASITLRNKILHKGKRDITRQEALNAADNVSQLANLIRRLTQELPK